MSDAAKAVVRRFVEEYQTGHDVSVAEDLLARDFVDHSPFGPLSPDRDGVLALFGMMFGAATSWESRRRAPKSRST